MHPSGLTASKICRSHTVTHLPREWVVIESTLDSIAGSAERCAFTVNSHRVALAAFLGSVTLRVCVTQPRIDADASSRLLRMWARIRFSIISQDVKR